jgi:hypothetical protein
MRRHIGIRILPALLLVGFLPEAYPGGIPEAHAVDDGNEHEAAAYVITRWNGGCDGDRRDYWDNMVSAWYDDIRDDSPLPRGHGASAYNIGWINDDGYVCDSQFVDPRREPWGNDVNYADIGDALMVGLHGGNDSNDHRWHGKVKYNEPGDGNCYAYQGDIELGDGDLEFLHLSSCYSMDREDWWNEWNSSFDGLHQVDGFHGIMWIDSDFVRKYRRFSDDAFWISIADSWTDHLYWTHWLLGNRDQCPVARNVGSSGDDSRDRMDSERYNLVFSDPAGVGEVRNHRARYVRGCNPRGKEALPQ